MKTIIEFPQELEVEIPSEKDIRNPKKLYNPDGLDHRVQLRVKSIECTDEHTRIDFLYTIPIDGWWISMEPRAYIQAKGSSVKYGLIQAIGIPIKPEIKAYRKRTTVTYTLIFPALPKNTATIDIIEKLAPGNYFNFFDVSYGKWMTVKHPIDFSQNNN
jgi:hypothetical protein